MRVIAVFVFLLLSGAAVQAQTPYPPYPPYPSHGQPPDFLGTWNNVELQRNMVVRIEIRPDYHGRVRVTIFGLRNGEPCIFGEYRGRFYVSAYPKEREQDNSAIMVKVDREFVHGHVLLRFNGRGEIVSHALLTFADGTPGYSVERFASAYPRGYNGGAYPPPPQPAPPAPPYYRGY